MIGKVYRKLRTEGVRGVVKAIGRRFFPPRPEPPFNPVRGALDAIFRDGSFTIIQIGAYVGDSWNDPLYQNVKSALQKGRGRLICVEPVKEHFDALVKNYRDVPNIICENVAVADHSGQSTFYRLGVNPADHGYPDWLAQLGSLKKERMESLWDKCLPDPEAGNPESERLKTFYLRHRVEETVTCVTFAELLARHRVTSVALLQMDTEGYDLELLRSIDFSAIPIRFVNYESVLLHERKPEAEALMQARGYLTAEHGQDTFCCKPADRRLIQRR